MPAPLLSMIAHPDGSKNPSKQPKVHHLFRNRMRSLVAGWLAAPVAEQSAGSSKGECTVGKANFTAEHLIAPTARSAPKSPP